MLDEYGIPEIQDKNLSDNLKMIYNDLRFVLKVPVVNFIFKTAALYENFLSIAWREVRPNMLTYEMEKAAETLRYPNISINVPTINWDSHYTKHEIMNIRKIIYTFNYVSAKILLIAAAWYESLSGRPILPKNKKVQFIDLGIISILPEIKLIDIENTTIPIKCLLKDIINIHQAIDVASYYRALANYPKFLNTSWSYLRDYVGTNEYTLIASEMKKKAISIAHDMPYPVTINKDLLSYFYSSKDIAGIMGVTSVFLNLIPSLIIDGEFFRRIITNS